MLPQRLRPKTRSHEHGHGPRGLSRLAAMSTGTRRGLTLGLALLAIGLVFDPPLGLQNAPAQAALPIDDPAPGSQERIADLLAKWNPYLSPEERGRIARAVLRWSDDYSLDPDLVLGVIYVESTARPEALSPVGAMGLMQVMPYMRRQIGLAGNSTTIESNIEAGCLILSDNIRRLGEDEGILAYFWGSDIRGSRYLHKVRHAQAKARRFLSQS